MSTASASPGAVPVAAPAAVGSVVPAASVSAENTSALGAGSVLTTTDPTRLLSRTVLGPGATHTVSVPGLPGDARAVVVNLTATDASVPTTVTACSGSGCSVGSAVSARPGMPVSRQVVAPVVNGKVSLRNSAGTVSVFVDLSAYVRPASTQGGEEYLPTPQRRVLSWQLLGARGTSVLQLPDVPEGATAVVLDVGYSSATARSFLSVCPADQSATTCVRTSAIQTVPGVNHSNSVVVPVDAAGRVKLYNDAGSVRVNADVQGWYVARGSTDVGGELVGASGAIATRLASAGATRTVTLPGVPAGASSAVIVVRSTYAAGGTGVWACPAAAVVAQCKTASVLNPLPGYITDNVAYVELGGSKGNQITLGSTTAAADITVSALGYTIHAAAAEPTPEPEPEPTPTASPKPTASASPKPSASPSPTAAVTGGKPGASNTGVPAGLSLKRHDGDIVVTQAGTVIENMDIHGFITVRAPDVTIRRSIVRGSGPGTTNMGLVNCNHNACSNLLVEDVTLAPKQPSVWLNGLFGHDYTARRVNTYHVVDGFQIHNVRNNGGPVNVVIENSWCHDMSYFHKDPNHDNTETHNDCIQIQGGTNMRITGNNLESFMATQAGDQNYDARNRGSALMVTPNAAPVSKVTMTGNWLDGGYASAYFSTSKFGAMNFGTFSGNMFGRNQYDHGRGSRYQIRIADSGVTFDNPLTTNKWADGSGNLAEGRDAGIRFGS
ncbi:hypothetical protein H9657_13360 [Cellulomonas sp. Sa3CUA2]|uniref:Right handed beta helix domain-containing protein n=1 Tax=Cellulomonas avistercoris TaxID=2762242 RepID=A0ABR8QFR5_9CELL|nr:hypothetical protein [Cellulomonas avistercoris]MBD7919259.1 hypothetical protein [Cellulomonas avistercoris]